MCEEKEEGVQLRMRDGFGTSQTIGRLTRVRMFPIAILECPLYCLQIPTSVR